MFPSLDLARDPRITSYLGAQHKIDTFPHLATSLYRYSSEVRVCTGLDDIAEETMWSSREGSRKCNILLIRVMSVLDSVRVSVREKSVG